MHFFKFSYQLSQFIFKDHHITTSNDQEPIDFITNYIFKYKI
jgi:hypothetical protein